MKYSPLPLEKTSYSFRQLRSYVTILYAMLAHAVKLLARMDPLKYLFEKPALTIAIASHFSEF